MLRKTAIVITSISGPNAVMRHIASSVKDDCQFIVIGDTASPPNFELSGCRYLSVSEQIDSGFRLARSCPTKHYARKNIGYLVAIRDGAEYLIETDDDNFPLGPFFVPRVREVSAAIVQDAGWCNAYRYFTDAVIWPRGFPLQQVKSAVPDYDALPKAIVNCPIQQGLADEDPDIDAVYRLLFPLPQTFRKDRQVALGKGSWCPFNSQNTVWWRDAFALLYLPAYCSFRMTDIWRSFVAQRIAWENDWHVLFHRPTVVQERNDHDLMKDFQDEISGYLNNSRICSELASLSLRSGAAAIPDNMLECYRLLTSLKMVGPEELNLLGAWLNDLDEMPRRN